MTNGTNLQNFSGGGLVTTAAVLAVALAQGRTADEVDLLALFFTALGDNLALFASQMVTESGGGQEPIVIAGAV